METFCWWLCRTSSSDFLLGSDFDLINYCVYKFLSWFMMTALCSVVLYDYVHCLLLRRNNKYIINIYNIANCRSITWLASCTERYVTNELPLSYFSRFQRQTQWRGLSATAAELLVYIYSRYWRQSQRLCDGQIQITIWFKSWLSHIW